MKKKTKRERSDKKRKRRRDKNQEEIKQEEVEQEECNKRKNIQKNRRKEKWTEKIKIHFPQHMFKRENNVERKVLVQMGPQ